MIQIPFPADITTTDPSSQGWLFAWKTGIGLQDVDGLRPSEYLLQTAIRNIQGELSFDEVQALLRHHYLDHPTQDPKDRTEEADLVSARIAALLMDRSFRFTPGHYCFIHQKLFLGLYPHAGKLRTYNITKREWVLNGATVRYGSALELQAALDYDFLQERQYNYQNRSMDEIIRHLAQFVSMLWQNHIFAEGNTRTTAVFFLQYLRHLGYPVSNDVFAENAQYFRNALVRANYADRKQGIRETTEYLEFFLRNLLLNEQNVLDNQALRISAG